MIFVVLEIFLMIFLVFVFFRFYSFLQNRFLFIKKKIHDDLKKITIQKLDPLLTQTGKGKKNVEIWWNQNWKYLVFIFTISLAASFLLQSPKWLLLPFIFGLLKYYIILKAAQHRKYYILKRIPFILDILILNLESGLDFISSLEELIKLNDDHPLLDEIKITLQEIRFGESRSKSFKNLGNRTGVPELSHLASSIQQSENMGSSLTELLRLQSQEIRYRIFKQAESEAQKAPVKILIPMLLFIFPVVFVILFVPIGIQLFTALK